MGKGFVWDFTVPEYGNYAAGGVINHNSGKTSAALIDLAWSLRGIHPFRPWCGPFTALCFAINRQQSAMVTQRKLFKALEIPASRLARTPEWKYEPFKGRAVVPGNQEDEFYQSLIGSPPASIESCPLLPDSEIEDVRGHRGAGFFTAYQVVMKNGCEAWFSWSDLEDTWMKIQGPKVGYIFLDENCGSRKLMIECRKRLQDSQLMADSARPKPGDDWRGRLVWAGHGTDDNDAFDEFADLCEHGIVRDGEGTAIGTGGSCDHELFDIKPGETGAVSVEARERFSAVLTDEERKVHIDGLGSTGDYVRIFKDYWDETRNIAPQTYHPHPDDNLWIGYDPGVDHPMGMVVCAITQAAPTSLRVIKAWNRKGGTIHDDVRELAAWLQGRRIAGFVYDAALAARSRGGGPTVLQQLKQAMSDAGVDPISWWKSKKNHAPGINLLRELMRDGKLVVDPEPETGGPQLVAQIRKLKGKEATKFTGEGGIVKKDDDLVDALRYIAMSRPGWTPLWRCGPMLGVPEVVDTAATAEGRDESMDELHARYPDEARQFRLSEEAALRRARGGLRRPRVWGSF